MEGKMIKDLKSVLFELIKSGQVSKVVVKDCLGFAEIDKITYDSYLEFKSPIKPISPSYFKNKCFGCGLDGVDVENTLLLNGLERL